MKKVVSVHPGRTANHLERTLPGKESSRQTVRETTTARKPLQAYRAILREETGTLTTRAGERLVCHDAGASTTAPPSMVRGLTVLGEIGLSEAQALEGRRHGGAAAVACRRQMEVASP